MFRVSHPISLAALLIFYSFIVGGLSLIYGNSWFLYLLVLVFLGGVIILIIYISTLSANEKFFKVKNNNNFIALLFLCVLILNNNVIIDQKINFSLNILNHLYSKTYLSITVYLIIYLLVTIVCVVKLVKFEEGPLVKRL